MKIKLTVKKMIKNEPLKQCHKALLKCEYCNNNFVENIFQVTRNSELVWKLIHIRNPISQHLEPKICCHACFSIKIGCIQSDLEPIHYQVLPTRELQKFIPKL